MLIYAHRAGRGLGPENTLEACALSLQFPIDYVDFDIALTRDGEIVVTHDLTLNPDLTRDVDGMFISKRLPIYEMSYDELSCYNVGQINPKSPYAAYFPQQRAFVVAKIPRLKDAIAFVKGHASPIGFQIEMKTDPTKPHLSASPLEFAERLVTLLQEHQITHISEVQAFDFRCLLAIQQLDPTIKTAYLTHSLPQADRPLWHAGYDLKAFGGSYPSMVNALGGACWEPFQMDLTQETLLEAKNLGLKVVVWGYPEKEGTDFNLPQMHQLMAWGVDGMITDRPDMLSAYTYASG
jgi:glycerophosphoryl diester phosphodiesterase